MTEKNSRELKRIFARFLFRVYKEYCNKKGCELIEVIGVLKEEIEKEYNKELDKELESFIEEIGR